MAAPGVPAAPILTILSSSSLRVEWVPPDDGGSPITEYIVFWGLTGGPSDHEARVSGTTREYVITGLTAGSRYTVRIHATNADGRTLGDPARITMPSESTSPLHPNNPTITSQSTSSLRASWSAPFDGGSPITEYQLTLRVRNTTSNYTHATVTGTSHTFTGLATNTYYEIRVRAHNAIGMGFFSGWTTSATRPGVPRSLAVDSSGPNSIQLAWLAPTGGNVPLTYDIAYKESGPASELHISSISGPSYTISGLSTSTTYLARIRARHEYGTGNYTPQESAITGASATRPGTPAAPTFSNITEDSVLVSWIAPNDGGSPITSYAVQHRRPGEAYQIPTQVSAPATSHTIIHLDPSTLYDVHIRARNSQGNGSYSPHSTFRTLGTVSVPSEISRTSSDYLGSGSIHVYWTEPADNGGAPIDYYQLRYSVDGGPDMFIDNLTTRSYTFNNLADGTYRFHARAHNSAGFSPYGFGSIVAVSEPPDTPTDLTGTAISGTAVALTWTAVADTIGETGYTIQWRIKNSGDPFTNLRGTGILGTTHTIPGLAPGITYEFRISAYAGGGASPYSSPIDVTTLNINISVVANPITVHVGGVVDLLVTSSDIDLTTPDKLFAWTTNPANQGTYTDPTTLNPEWTAPLTISITTIITLAIEIFDESMNSIGTGITQVTVLAAPVQTATGAALRTLGTGAGQAAAGNHHHRLT